MICPLHMLPILFIHPPGSQKSAMVFVMAEESSLVTLKVYAIPFSFSIANSSEAESPA